MKKLLIALFCLTVGVAGANAQENKTANPNGPKFKFKEETHDFGEIPEGPVAEYKFEFTNVGKEPLIIQNASASCGCTTPEWQKDPVLPGKKSTVTVHYNTQGRVGPFTKDVYIQSNAVGTEPRYTIHIKGTVKAGTKPNNTTAPSSPATGAPKS